MDCLTQAKSLRVNLVTVMKWLNMSSCLVAGDNTVWKGLQHTVETSCTDVIKELNACMHKLK